MARVVEEVEARFPASGSDRLTGYNVNMSVISVRVEKSGRVLIPAAVRRKLGLKEGESEVLLDVDETPIKVTTRRQRLERARAILRKYHKPGEDWTAELLADRREESRREDAE
jgi:AbrB family looped-hinge helix DNA binding protein